MNKKICFVALGAYPLLMGTNINYVGGPEIHQTSLARELVKHNFEVVFIVYNEDDGPRFRNEKTKVFTFKYDGILPQTVFHIPNYS